MTRVRTLVMAFVVGLSLIAGACGSGGEPAYEATDLTSGEPVSVESLRGRPALLVSWATWCNECDEELAGLAEFARSADAQGIAIVAVNLDAANVDGEIRAKIERHDLRVELWRDRRNEFKRSFGALGVPTTVLLDSGGAIAGMFPGAVDFGDDDVLEALAEVKARS